MGVTITKQDGTVSSSSGAVSTAEANQQSDKFALGRALHLTSDGRVVEETDPEGVTVLGGAGRVMSDAEVKRYELNDTHRLAAPPVEPPKSVVKEAVKEAPVMKEPVKEKSPEKVTEKLAEPKVK